MNPAHRGMSRKKGWTSGRQVRRSIAAPIRRCLMCHGAEVGARLVRAEDAQLLTVDWNLSLHGSWGAFLAHRRAPIAGNASAQARRLANGG